MNRKTLACGILLLFIGSILSPVAFGINVQEYEDESFLDEIEYIYGNPLNTGNRKSMDYTRINAEYQAIDDLSPFIEDTPVSPLGGPIDSAWPMQSQNQNHTGLSPYNTASNPGVEKWRIKTESAVDGGIAIGPDETLYFGDFYGDVIALNPDGSLKWKYATEELVLMCCPCIGQDGTIYVSASGYELYAFHPNGSPKWIVNTGGNMGNSPAIADDGTVYIGHSNNDMVAVNPNGTIKWKYTTGSWIACDPTIHPDGTVIFGSSDEFIYALNPNGTLRWNYKTDNIVRGHASIDGEGIIWMSCWDGYLYAFYVNGTLKHKYDMPIPGGETMAFGPDGYIYVTYDGLAKINPDDGSTIWKFDYLEDEELAYLSSPAISADGIIYIGTAIDEVRGGQIYAINPDGALRWRKIISNVNTASSPTIAEDGTVYIGSNTRDGLNSGVGYVHAFNDKGDNYAPNPPLIEFHGETKGRFIPLEFSFVSTDPDFSPLQVYVEWGDGDIEDWGEERASGEKEGYEHTYTQKGPFTIRAKARDIFGLESDWGYFELNMPATYHYPGWQWLGERFPLLSRLLNLLGGIE